jgi:hypothetical protein
MRRRTPEEKKQLSLAKDRRNVYGEPPHGARKSIPLQKRLRNRANRHSQDAPLLATPKQFDIDEADKIESAIYAKAPKRWEKVPDAPLGDVIALNQEQREQSHGRRAGQKSTA